MSSLLDQYGEPISQAIREPEKAKSLIGSSYSTYLQSLSSLDLPAEARVRNPFRNHPWVFAAAMMTSIAASQATYRIYRDSEFDIEKRFGKRRRIVAKYVRASLSKRITRTKSAEEDFNHDFLPVLTRPNPYQDGSQLMQVTHLWMALRGECFWILSKEGSSVGIGEYPDSIYPISPDLMEPIREFHTRGALIGWRFNVPHWHPDAKFNQLSLPLTDVIQFKFPNPEDPTRGISRLTAAAIPVETDLSIQQLGRRQIKNGAVPKGVLSVPYVVESEAEKERLLSKFEERHQGPDNTDRPAMLTGGLTYTPTQMSPRDMEFLGQRQWNREEVLAVMGTPKSVVGVTEQLNYATQLGQDRGYWEKTIIPQLNCVEAGIDSTIFFEDGDSSFGLFDLSEVEALRAGVGDKLNQAVQMTGSTLHVPPRTAFEFLGLEVPEYEGDDVSLVPGLGTVPLGEVLSGEPDLGEEPESTEEESFGDLPVPLLSRKDRNSRRHRDYLRRQAQIEVSFKKKYRSWISGEKREALRLFDDVTKSVELEAVLPDLKKSQNEIRARLRAVYQLALEETFSFTDSELGIATFAIDDPFIIQFFDKRLDLVTSATPVTVRKNLMASLAEGIKNGESVGSLRKRVAQVYDISASSSKALQVARTESSGFMSGVRDKMFELSGVDQSSWSTSADENVRSHHVEFGASGTHTRGFNYLELIGSSAGVLSHPLDLRCTDPSLVISCRCLEIAEG